VARAGARSGSRPLQVPASPRFYDESRIGQAGTLHLVSRTRQAIRRTTEWPRGGPILEGGNGICIEDGRRLYGFKTYSPRSRMDGAALTYHFRSSGSLIDPPPPPPHPPPPQHSGEALLRQVTVVLGRITSDHLEAWEVDGSARSRLEPCSGKNLRWQRAAR